MNLENKRKRVMILTKRLKWHKDINPLELSLRRKKKKNGEWIQIRTLKVRSIHSPPRDNTCVTKPDRDVTVGAFSSKSPILNFIEAVEHHVKVQKDSLTLECNKFHEFHVQPLKKTIL